MTGTSDKLVDYICIVPVSYTHLSHTTLLVGKSPLFLKSVENISILYILRISIIECSEVNGENILFVWEHQWVGIVNIHLQQGVISGRNILISHPVSYTHLQGRNSVYSTSGTTGGAGGTVYTVTSLEMCIRDRVTNEDITPGDNSLLKVDIDDTDPLVLSHKENIFSVHFAALDYTNPQNIQYAYILDGFEKQWTFADKQRSVT